ncbi:methyltransferase [Paenibacillus selenitireducens]|uniref:Methyltransferase n=1 Tax=Paenibacillus selenitireducens TaxID=1324314 RepID=A0A1T2X2P5_9BACL|nr:methyltransferase domain-containing protein [Paenibacillus selenitireducens]OPA73853.1 methyltransferase [Paenibacillus selenitireducens]
MEEYYWDTKIEYLKNTRNLYYNDDYLEFLVKQVWKIQSPVHIVDYGCGYGYLGLKLLPLLPPGSSYTGMDQGEKLIDKAKEIYKNLPYKTTFIVRNIEELQAEPQYDIAICHAFLLHMTDPQAILGKMIRSVVDGGMIICMEPHWISAMSNIVLHGEDSSNVANLGILQKLFENDQKRLGKDGNIGLKLPIYLSQLGVRHIQCRVSDKVNFLDVHMNEAEKEQLFQSILEDGLGSPPGNREEVIANLIQRGLTRSDAERQYEIELNLSQILSIDSYLVSAPNMKITFGTVIGNS